MTAMTPARNWAADSRTQWAQGMQETLQWTPYYTVPSRKQLLGTTQTEKMFLTTRWHEDHCVHLRC